MTIREREILAMIKENPMVSQQEIAEKLNITRSAVSTHILSLNRKGAILGRGYIVHDASYCVVIGAVTADLIGVFQSNYFDSRFDDESEISITYGGNGKNLSENLVRLGGEVKLITAIGSDMISRDILKECGSHGISTEHCLITEDEAPSLYMELTDRAGSIFNGVGNMVLQKKLTPDFIESKIDLLKNAEKVICDEGLPRETLLYLSTRPGIREKVIVWSKKAERVSRLVDCLPTLGMLICEEACASQLLEGRKGLSLMDAAREISKTGCSDVVVYRKGENLLAYSGSGRNEQFAFRSTNASFLSSRGSDAAFVAALIHYLDVSTELRQAAANAFAAREITCLTKGMVNYSLSDTAIRNYAGQYFLPGVQEDADEYH